MFKKNLTRYALVSIFIYCVGCSPIKGYPGAPRESEEVALVMVRDHTDVSWSLTPSEIFVDQIGLGDRYADIEVLPGTHSAQFRWTYTSGIIDDLLTVNPAWTKSGICRISFSVRAGKKYTIEPVLQRSGTWVSDPRVSVSVHQMSNATINFGNDIEKVATGLCEYGGRDLGVRVEIDPTK